MKKGFFGILILGVLFAVTGTFQDGQQLCEGIAPANDLYIAVDDKAADGISEEEFNEIWDILEEIYVPIFKADGREFIINRKWNDGTVNAYATRSGKQSVINMFGGFARYPGMDKIGMAMVGCHEIGHHLGGAPNYTRFFFKIWASNEGQSDYFATLKCMRKYFEKTNFDMTTYDFNPVALQKCEKLHGTQSGVNHCLLNSIGAMKLAEVLNALRSATTPLGFDTPDPKVVKKTYHKHPEAQCRLDTYFAGAICDVDHSEDIDLKDVYSAQCNRKDGYTEGVRPLCWYKPKKK